MYKYNLSWTTKDGRRVENQLFTAEHISHKLAELEQAECSSISLESIDRGRRAVFIPSSDDFHDMWELLLNNNYDVIADPEAHTLDIWEEQFIEADDILIENRVNHTILF